jgi:hypothetical protein
MASSPDLSMSTLAYQVVMSTAGCVVNVNRALPALSVVVHCSAVRDLVRRILGPNELSSFRGQTYPVACSRPSLRELGGQWVNVCDLKIESERWRVAITSGRG